jgi:SAM-dependent methyltransferase
MNTSANGPANDGMAKAREEFAKIYREHVWGGTSRSGPGSDPEVLRPYAELLSNFLRERNIRSVVDVGCGDWALGRTLDWTGIDYTGVDIVPEVIEMLNATYGSSNVRFLCRELVADELPCAELCVIKDVLQHLSNESVRSFIEKLRSNFKMALLTNDISHRKQGNWRTLWKTEVIEANSGIPNGGYRPLRLRETPFHLPAQCLLTIAFRFERAVFDHPGVVYETKEVLLWENTLGVPAQNPIGEKAFGTDGAHLD